MAITLEELAKEVQKLKDIEEIKVLKARYSAMCDDNHNWTLIKELFAPDAQWVGDPTQPWGGGSNREEIEKLFQFYQTQMDGVPLKGVLGHNPMAPQITVADDGVHATGKWNMFGAFRMFEGRAKTGSKSFLEQGKYNRIVGMKGEELVDYPVDEALEMTKSIDPVLVDVCNTISI